MLNALREVEDALVTYRVDRASRDLLQDTLDSAQLTRQEDISIRALLTLVSGTTQFARALNTLRRSWSSAYRERWSAVFFWPDRRDMVLWAQSEEGVSWFEHRARELAESSPTI